MLTADIIDSLHAQAELYKGQPALITTLMDAAFEICSLRDLLGNGQPDLRSMPRDPKWDKVRDAHVAEFPTCAACGTKQKPQVHHKKPFHLKPALELDPKNLITLCGFRCHLLIGHLGSWFSFNPDVEEDAARLLKKILHRPTGEEGL